jgi:hypothetical protein
MAGTTRTRKTATAKTTETADTTTEAAEPAAAAEAEETVPVVEEAALADSAAKAPEAAPLEPPAVQEPPAAPAAPVYATPTEVIPDEANLAEVIVDDATKQPPADVDSVFVPLTEYGSVLVCTMRLVEETFLGPHHTPVHRLLQPAGAHVSEGVAARIKERLRDQAARIAAQAEK